MTADLQDGVAEFEHLRGDPAAALRAHVGQDVRKPPGELRRAGELGVEREAGGDAPVLGVRLGPGLQRGGVGGQYQQTFGPGADQRVRPPQHVRGLPVAGRGVDAGAAGRGVRAVRGEHRAGPVVQAAVQAVPAGRSGLTGLVRAQVLRVEHSADGEQVGGRAADGLLARYAEQTARPGAPVGHQATAVHDDNGQRDPPGRRGALVRRHAEVHGSRNSFPFRTRLSAGPHRIKPRYGHPRYGLAAAGRGEKQKSGAHPAHTSGHVRRSSSQRAPLALFAPPAHS